MSPAQRQALNRARTGSDKKWLKMLIRSISSPVVDGIEFPRFPPEELQTTFVGSANESALREAYAFYVFVKAAARAVAKPLRPDSRFLDFGCGWGRYLRFFWRDVDEANLYGCDVNQAVVDLCRELHVPGTIDHIDPRGTLPYASASFDAIIAYSVFTHLPEDVHLHWMRELARVARPGAAVCLTLEPRRFLDFIRDTPSDAPHEWHRALTAHRPQLPECYRAFDAGEFVFLPTNRGMEDTYGDAVVPLSYVERSWSPHFSVEDYVDDPRKFWQAVLVARRS